MLGIELMKNFGLHIITILVVLGLASCGGGGGEGGGGGTGTGLATLKWTAPTKNSDDTPFQDPAGYNIYYGNAASQLVSKVSITDPSVREYVVQNLNTNTVYYFAVTAVNSLNRESFRSTIVSKQL